MGLYATSIATLTGIVLVSSSLLSMVYLPAAEQRPPTNPTLAVNLPVNNLAKPKCLAGVVNPLFSPVRFTAPAKHLRDGQNSCSLLREINAADSLELDHHMVIKKIRASMRHLQA